MKVTYPHMGTLNIVLNALLREVDLEVVPPPPITKRTLELGIANSPEFACLPLKITLGNFLEALERGAELIIMAGGCGPCRFGYYAQVQREILTDLGCNFEMLVLEPPQSGWPDFLKQIRSLLGGLPVAAIRRGWILGWQKVKAIDWVEEEVERTRPVEPFSGQADRIFRDFLAQLDQTTTTSGIQRLTMATLGDLQDLRNGQRANLQVGVVGEIYTVLEPAANQDLLRRLGSLGVEVRRKLRLSHWIGEHLTLNKKKKRRLRLELEKLAAPYLKHFVGGHGLESVGHTIELCREGVAGVIQIAPLTCMPEIVAESVLPQVSADLSLPVLTLFVDEHTAEAGLQTRLEAFIDLLPARSISRKSI
ncbi:MAG: CoA protein activase [Firmicutes bacterium]|nr:CoA protein activase [Bacillota bacterium]